MTQRNIMKTRLKTKQSIEMYQNGKTCQEIDQFFGLKKRSTDCLLRRHKVLKLQYRTEQEINISIQMYKCGKNGREIDCHFGLTNGTTTALLHRHGINVNSDIRNKKHSYNETIFNIINSPEKAYWIGFLLGDASISRTSLRLELSNKDLDHLEKFKQFMQATYSISSTRKNCSLITICGKQFIHNITQHGLVIDKTHKPMKTPNTIPKKLLKYFYRGIMDSDGWVCSHYIKKRKYLQHEFGFCSSSKEFLEEIQTWIASHLNTHGYLKERIRENQRVVQLIFGGNSNFVKINKIFGEESFYLNRKKEKIKECIQYITANNLGN